MIHLSEGPFATVVGLSYGFTKPTISVRDGDHLAAFGISDMHSSAEQACHPKRGYPRISLLNGMFVAWHGGDLLLISRVKTVSMGGLFISVPSPPTVGTKLRLAFEVPGGNVRAEGIIRNVLPGEGMDVEFTRIDLKDRVLLGKLMNRLLG